MNMLRGIYQSSKRFNSKTDSMHIRGCVRLMLTVMPFAACKQHGAMNGVIESGVSRPFVPSYAYALYTLDKHMGADDVFSATTRYFVAVGTRGWLFSVQETVTRCNLARDRQNVHESKLGHIFMTGKEGWDESSEIDVGVSSSQVPTPRFANLTSSAASALLKGFRVRTQAAPGAVI